jgi:hypothetical protein
MAKGNVTIGADIPGEKSQAASSKPDASHTLREQYFECLAAGQTQCTYTSADRTAKPSNERAAGHSLEMTNPYAADKPVTQPTPIDSSVVLPRSNWTVAINLTTTLDVAVNPHSRNSADVHDGARTKTAQLLEIAESTKGKPVTMVVQNAEPDPNFKPSHSKDVDAVPSTGPARPNNMLLHTYIIHDGKIDELPSRPSGGIAADTQALLTTAGKQAPADHIAFISQSHGGGPDGIEGDTGRATLDEVNAAIKNGLQGSGHEKLDVLDFDACSMGNARVLAALAHSADQIVASTETEAAGGSGADGQNTQAMMQALLNKTDMTPAQLAEHSIKIANAGLNDDHQRRGGEAKASGTSTLSQYDASKIDSFNHDVDGLGNALSNAWNNPNNHNAIRAAIENTPLSTKMKGHLADRPEAEERDVKTLATNLVRDIKQGSISDPDGSLKRASEALLNSMQAMVTHYHGAHEKGYDRQGGVSLFMPGHEFLDNQARANDTEDIARLTDIDNQRKNSTLDSKDSVLSRVDYAIADGKQSAGSQSAAAFAPLEQARESLAHATTQQEYTRALTNLAQESKRFLTTDAGRAIMNSAIQTMTHNMNDVMQGQEDPTNVGWNHFLATLANDAPQVYRN